MLAKTKDRIESWPETDQFLAALELRAGTVVGRGDAVEPRVGEIKRSKAKRGMIYSYRETEDAVVLLIRSARRLVQAMGPELSLLQDSDDVMCFKADGLHDERSVV